MVDDVIRAEFAGVGELGFAAAVAMTRHWKSFAI